MNHDRDTQSSKMTRREMLKLTGAGAVGLGLGLGWSGPAIATSDSAWGCLPSGVWAADFEPYKILEIHLFGGYAPYEAFYYRDVAGSRTRGFDTEVQNLNWNPTCTNTPTGLETLAFSTDSNGKAIHLGPFSKPLWRQDIRRRMRVLVQHHNLLPHEAAIPLAMTGLRLGRPNLCPLGAPIQHRLSSLDQEAGNNRVLPHSYALLPENGGIPSLFNLVAQVQRSVGTHPGASQPLVLRIGPALGNFISQLGRGNLGGTKAAVNALIDQFRSQYRDFLRWPTTDEIIRSSAFRDFDTAATRLMESGALETLLNSAPTTIGTADSCAAETLAFVNAANNPTRTALQFAAFLLTRAPEQAASSVFVLDSGLVREFLPYDVHSTNHATDTASNLRNVLNSLVSVIRDPANPTPQDADKIDLTKTLIILNAEFGRTPFKSSMDTPNLSSLGRDHWPGAYVTVLMGGPIPDTADGTAGRVVGSISDGADETVAADVPYNSTDMRAAALVAAGIHPFENENFAQGQLTASLQGMNHTATMVNLRQTLLGVA